MSDSANLSTKEADAYLALPTFEVRLAEGTFPREFRVGDTVKLEVAGVKAADVEAPPKDGKSENLLSQGWEIFALGDTNQESQVTYLEAIAMKPGRNPIGPFILKDKTGSQIGRTLPLDLQAEVASGIAENDPKPREAVPSLPPLGLRFPTILAVSIGTVLILLLGALGFYFYRRWKNRVSNVNPIPIDPRTEDEIALDALQHLRKVGIGGDGWVGRGEFKRFYFSLSEIVKNYIGKRYGFEALDCTSSEVLVTLSKKGVDILSHEDVKKFFESLDRVKFTDQIPELSEPESLLDAGKTWVLKTRRPKPVVPQGVQK